MRLEEYTVQPDGSLRLPKEALESIGLKASPGSRIAVGKLADGDRFMHEPPKAVFRNIDQRLTRLYVEPTTRCNLACTTCIRNTWSECLGTMEWTTYERLLEGARRMGTVERINFWGYGEPLLHPRIVDMVREAHALGLKTHMISNAMLLTRETGQALLDAGLDEIVFSIDGAEASIMERIREGADFGRVTENIRRFAAMRTRQRGRVTVESRVRIGIEFVALKSSVFQLPAMRDLSADLGADFLFVSNVLPFRKEEADEILYQSTVDGLGNDVQVYLPPLDNEAGAAQALAALVPEGEAVPWLKRNDLGSGWCPFVGHGSAVVSWRGDVSPCMSLLHSAPCYVLGRAKSVHGVSYGNVNDDSLENIWSQADYRAFRERAQRFEFAPCTGCTGCRLAETNGRDCHGSPAPSCGDCLWARGLVQCP